MVKYKQLILFLLQANDDLLVIISIPLNVSIPKARANHPNT